MKTTHGLWNHRLYHTWKSMKRRVFDIKSKSYKHYGGRGITICDRWLDVKNFIDDMYPSYKEGLELDRINNNGNYEPNNCRWTTRSVQCRNTVRIMSRNTSGYRGVGFNKHQNKFVASITINRRRTQIGAFKTAEEAGYAYDKYVIDNNLEHTTNGFKILKNE